MNRLLAILILVLLFYPMQYEANPIYEASGGKIGIGSWFYYNSTFTGLENRSYNYTITWMSNNTVKYNVTTIYESGYIITTTKTVDLTQTYKIDFWIDMDSFVEQLRELNGTTPTVEITVNTWILFMNNTCLHYKMKTSSATKDVWDEEIIRINQYGVITYAWINKTIINVGSSTKTVKIMKHELVSWKYQNIKENESEEAPGNNLLLIAVSAITLIAVVSIGIFIIKRRATEAKEVS